MIINTNAEKNSYTKNEVNALLASKAPIGFGLGDFAPYIDDCNKAVLSGWYKWDINCANAPFDYATMISSGRYDSLMNQIAICNAGPDQGKMAYRAFCDGIGEWQIIESGISEDYMKSYVNQIVGAYTTGYSMEPFSMSLGSISGATGQTSVTKELDLDFNAYKILVTCTGSTCSLYVNGGYAYMAPSTQEVELVNGTEINLCYTTRDSSYYHYWAGVYLSLNNNKLTLRSQYGCGSTGNTTSNLSGVTANLTLKIFA